MRTYPISPTSTMSHTLDIQSSILVAGLALVPGNTAHYICLTLIFGLLAYHAARGQTPAAKIQALTAAIASANQLLNRALCTARDQVFSMEQELRLRMNTFVQSINKCTKDVKRIQSKLQLSIRCDTQRKLDGEIQKSREMLAAIHSGHRIPSLRVDDADLHEDIDTFQRTHLLRNLERMDDRLRPQP
ncbi:hypothetical protein GGX14DRAFT_587083 [Mycena pura]|uniref:Uncharacterized protein n=1 Tax=Mycena pura TaxID=153505 RepID=A0AAD6XZN2_9AGAR|nr:hypothetical protein GGX14DRAFT_587083 [Mycena pura]